MRNRSTPYGGPAAVANSKRECGTNSGMARERKQTGDDDGLGGAQRCMKVGVAVGSRALLVEERRQLSRRVQRSPVDDLCQRAADVDGCRACLARFCPAFAHLLPIKPASPSPWTTSPAQRASAFIGATRAPQEEQQQHKHARKKKKKKATHPRRQRNECLCGSGLRRSLSCCCFCW